MNFFKAILALFILSIALFGCDPMKSTAENNEPGANGQSDSANAVSGDSTNAQNGGGSQGGGSGEIAPMAGVGAGPMTPVSGAESVGGGGGGAVGQVAKNKAKEVAASAPSSINGATDDGQ